VIVGCGDHVIGHGLDVTLLVSPLIGVGRCSCAGCAEVALHEAAIAAMARAGAFVVSVETASVVAVSACADRFAGG
jgi:hypothetical protein